MKPHVCFVAPNNYGVLSGREDIRHVGGAEVQRLIVARELVRRGYEVSFITYDYGQADGVVHGGIRVFKMCTPSAGLPGLRFFHPRWSSLWRAMARADADVYYQRTAGAESGQVALWCRLKKRPLVLAIANDPECDRRLGGSLFRRERWMHYYALKHADVIVAQTSTQRRMLQENFGLHAEVIRSCVRMPDSVDGGQSAHGRTNSTRVLWVGRFSEQKRPEMLMSLAEQCPSVTFDVVGVANMENAATRSVRGRLRSLNNVVLHGFVPHERINVLYEQAALLVCTSAWEGFPNTFLEAWSYGIPVVSTVDPDGVIGACGLGVFACDVGGLASGVQRLLSRPQEWAACSQAARTYCQANHSIGVVGDAYERVFQSLMQGRKAAGGDVA